MEEKKRTIKQNNSLHMFCELLAQELTDAGYDMKKTLKPTVDIPWTGESIKKFIWKPIQESMFGKASTTELTTAEVSKVYDVINRHIGERFGLYVPFPNMEELINNYEQK